MHQPPAYGAPAPGYGAPGYGAPAYPDLGAAPGYGAPAPGYAAPAPGYGGQPGPGQYAAPGYGGPEMQQPPYGAPPQNPGAPGFAPAPAQVYKNQITQKGARELLTPKFTICSDRKIAATTWMPPWIAIPLHG